MDDIPHRPFPKIPTTLGDAAGAGAQWVATEKIHGAQLVLATDGARVQIGKRKAWLGERDAFFGWQLLRNELSLAARACHQACQRAVEGAQLLYIYGELFGGVYPHPEVEALPGLSAVQTGIYYAAGLRFAAFDMLVVPGSPSEDEDEDEDSLFLAHAQLEDIAAQAGLATVPLLGRGTRRELERLPVRYPSRVAEQLGLPPLPTNVAEGYVLKPDRALAPGERPVVKHKIPEFDDARFDASAPFDQDAHLSIDALLSWAAQLVNPMRIASARSKVGEDPDAVAEEALLDVWIDLEAIFPRRMLALLEPEEERLRARTSALVEQALEAAGLRANP